MLDKPDAVKNEEDLIKAFLVVIENPQQAVTFRKRCAELINQ